MFDLLNEFQWVFDLWSSVWGIEGLVHEQGNEVYQRKRGGSGGVDDSR